jgi:hypothetical protein
MDEYLKKQEQETEIGCGILYFILFVFLMYGFLSEIGRMYIWGY